MKLEATLAAVSLLITTLAPAATVSPAPVPPKPNVILVTERSYINSCIGIMENEILNNSEEEYILLASGNPYFTGFGDGMTSAILQLSEFNFTGDPVTDFAAIGSNFLSAENAADALGTTYGTGVGTAYQYALVVLNRDPASTIFGQSANPRPQASSPDTQVSAPASRRNPVQVPNARERELP